MTTLLLVLRFFNLFAAALSAGGMAMVSLVVNPVKWEFAAPLYAKVHDQVYRKAFYMKLCGPTAGLTALLLLILGHDLLPMPAFVLYIAGLVGTFTITLTSWLHLIPVNRKVARWTEETIPANWTEVQHKWNVVYNIRTGASVWALTCFLLAVLLSFNT